MAKKHYQFKRRVTTVGTPQDTITVGSELATHYRHLAEWEEVTPTEAETENTNDDGQQGG